MNSCLYVLVAKKQLPEDSSSLCVCVGGVGGGGWEGAQGILLIIEWINSIPDVLMIM